MTDKLDAVGGKITAALKVNPPSGGMVGFALFLSGLLSPEDFAVLEAAEKEFGEETCNDWMSKVLIQSGRYEKDGQGTVVLRGDDCVHCEYENAPRGCDRARGWALKLGHDCREDKA